MSSHSLKVVDLNVVVKFGKSMNNRNMTEL